MDRRLDKGATTRAQIVDAATRCFAADGYEATSIERVLVESGVSRGALYHHFRGKEALFVAVFEAVETRVLATVAQSAEGLGDPSEALGAACQAWLALVAKDEAVRRIVVVDAPFAMGWRAWREMEARYGLGLLQGALSAAAAMGRVPTDQVSLYAHILLAALVEVALLVARAAPSEREAATRSGSAAIERLISCFVAPAGGAVTR